MNQNSLSFQLGTSVAQYLMQYGQKELNYDEFKAGIDYVMNLSVKAKEEGEKFLAENAKREGVKVTPSGLQYEVLEATLGQKPKATDRVKVHYEGTLPDGTVFDSSYRRGEPITFALNQVIAGWTEGLQLMSIGSKYKLFIPYHLGYGEHGAGASIPPYSALVFTVELLGINE
jgi:FKBP-type peptidyl-prolyl cis-trans isomerase FklB